jgi:hypothetical protein
MGLFQKAKREALFLRMSISAPPKGGKTWTGLAILRGVVGPEGRIAVIDTERRSALIYARDHEFQHIQLVKYHPDAFIHLINAAVEEGFDGLLIDSFSHEWVGEGGALDIVDSKSGDKGGSFGAFKVVTPLHNKVLTAIRSSEIHIIATMRAKVHYDVEKGANGTIEITKNGMEAIQRAGTEYEFDICGEMDVRDHSIYFDQTRCRELDKRRVQKPDYKLGEFIGRWLRGEDAERIEVSPLAGALMVGNGPKPKAIEQAGKSPSEPAPETKALVNHLSSLVSQASQPPVPSHASESTLAKLHRVIGEVGMPVESLANALAKRGVKQIGELSEASAVEMIAKIESILNKRLMAQPAPPTPKPIPETREEMRDEIGAMLDAGHREVAQEGRAVVTTAVETDGSSDATDGPTSEEGESTDGSTDGSGDHDNIDPSDPSDPSDEENEAAGTDPFETTDLVKPESTAKKRRKPKVEAATA